MVAQRESRPLTIAEWHALEQAHPDQKIEYFDGQVSFMSSGSLAHSRISSNTLRTLEDALGTGPCNVYNSNASVKLATHIPMSRSPATRSINQRQIKCKYKNHV
jgi:Uma2 family endonuclease